MKNQTIVVNPKEILEMGVAIFSSLGSSTPEAETVTGELLTSSLMGVDSHGVSRIPQYVEEVHKGMIVPGGKIEVEQRTPSTLVVHCGRNFGQVGAMAAIEVGIEAARETKVACVITKECNHVGRLGAYPQRAAEEGLVTIATCNSPAYGHFVLPWGGKDPRLATNPIAYAFPSSGWPILADITTSAAPEGKIRMHRNKGASVPEGWIVDAHGRATTDPNHFYGPPRGAILPFGGRQAGHKGYSFGLLVDLLSGCLSGIPITDPEWVGNGVCFIIIDPAAFMPLEVFKGLVDQIIDYMKSSTPVEGVEEVLVPGEPEFRTMAARKEVGIPVDSITWRQIQKLATKAIPV